MLLHAVTLYSTTSEAQQWGILVEEDSVVGIVGTINRKIDEMDEQT